MRLHMHPTHDSPTPDHITNLRELSSKIGKHDQIQLWGLECAPLGGRYYIEIEKEWRISKYPRALPLISDDIQTPSERTEIVYYNVSCIQYPYFVLFSCINSASRCEAAKWFG